jgi:type IV pilus assembly protein PilY1
MKKLINGAVGFLLATFLSAPVYAFAPVQAPILSAAAVTPNVMFLLDNSGSMDHLVWHSGYVDTVSYPAVDYCRRTDGGICDRWGSVAINDSFNPNTAKQASCAAGQTRFRIGTTQRCLQIPDPVGGNNTRVKGNYIRFLVSAAIANAEIPNEYRMRAARDVVKQLVADNRDLRYGLFSFNPANNSAGGSLRYDVSNFSRAVNPLGVEVVSAVQATTNFNAFNTQVDQLTSATWTPLAEAYYEVTRYFRGMSRYQGSGTGNYTSPIQYRCQKNFGIVVTDGLPTFDRTFPADDPLRNNPLVAATSNDLPNWDGSGAGTDGANLAGNGEGDTLYLDDIAGFAYDIDLRTAGNDAAGKSFEDPAFIKQNMNTYTVGFAVNNQMLAAAADSSHGRGSYYTANNSDELAESLTQAINEISSKSGSGGAGASSSATLTAETRYYKTLYDPIDWRGTIEAYSLSPSSGRIIAQLWTTDTTITPFFNLATYQTYNTSTNSVVALDYNSVSTAQQIELSSSLDLPATGPSLVSWVKGNNVAGLRDRTVLLGDVINSSLERMSSSEQLAASITGDTSYTAYLATKSAMTDSLLVNANDGLFHVIDADNGSHRYGYLASTLFPYLNIVADTGYAENKIHRFMADGRITVADAQLSDEWATVAVAGLGAGGKSMFAVKLFDGSNASNDISALWEASPPAVSTPANVWNNIGYTYSKAVVARTKANQWVAIFGNGYGSHLGKASLYVVDLATGALVKEIVVDESTSGTPDEIAAGSGLSSPQVVVNAQYQIEKVYAGDLRGKLWEFDLSGSTSLWSAAPLFDAGAGHPITVQPLVVEHPNGGYMIEFGTGKLSESADKIDSTLQSFYGIWDDPAASVPVTQGDLQAQSITNELVINGGKFFTSSQSTVDWNTQKGWYLPLIYNAVATGERVIYPAQTTEGRVVFVTARVDASDPCQSSGSGRLVELDLLTGAMLSDSVLDTDNNGLLTSADQVTSGAVLEDGLPGMPVIIDKGPEKKTQTKIILLSTGINKFIDERAGSSETIARRIMWRQLQ